MSDGHSVSPLFSWRKALTISTLEPTTRLVGFALSLHMNEAGGSCFPSQNTLAQETGLSRSTVNTHLRKLLDEGFLLMANRRRQSDGRQSSNEYRAVIPSSLIEVMEAESRGGVKTKWLEPRVRENDTDPRDWGTRTRATGEHQEDVIEGDIEDAQPPASPPLEGGDVASGGTLFDGRELAAVSGGRKQAKRSAQSKEIPEITRAEFGQWLEAEFPKGKGRGPFETGCRAWHRAMQAGVTVSEITRQARNYVAALGVWAEVWPDHPRRPMSASAFIGGRTPLEGKRLRWDEPWTVEDAAAYWPPPRGYRWEDRMKPGGRLSFAEMMALEKRGELENLEATA